MNRNGSFRSLCVLFSCLLFAGCEAIDVWTAPTPTPEQYDKGLIVFYPGSAGLNIEAIGFYYAFREAGIDLAFEETLWTGYLETIVSPEGVQDRITERCKAEANRIAEYIRAYPNRPVTLISYSGGAIAVIRVAENMPPDVKLDRLITMSPGIWKGIDLTGALDNTTQGMINYWSPIEYGPILVSRIFGLADSSRLDPACSFGFDQVDPRLTQVAWSEELSEFDNRGEHLDFLINIPWLKKFVAPWIITSK